MLKRAASFILFLGLVVLSFGVEIKHPVATVKVKGDWKTDSESNENLLILVSDPEGKQIVVSILRLDRQAANLDQIAQAAAKVFESRTEAAQRLAPGVLFDKPEVTTTKTTVTCICRGYAAKSNVRLVFRVDGFANAVRTVSAYDYTGMDPAAFKKWSTEVLAGIK